MADTSAVMESAVADGAAVAWLYEIAHTRDLTLPVPDGVPAGEAPVLAAFVAGLRAELRAFRDVVRAADESAALNARQLAQIVGSTGEHRVVVERTAAAIAEADRGAAHVANTSDALRTLSGRMRAATGRYDAGVDDVRARLAELATTVQGAAGFAGAMDRDSRSVAGFVDRLGRIARQAHLLSINAAIEAAHLGDAGRGFVIVAEQVKALAESTADSARNVAGIEKQLRSVSAEVARTTSDSAANIARLADELAAARHRSRDTLAQVTGLDEAIDSVASIAAQQSAALTAVTAGISSVAEHAGDAERAAQRAGELALGDALARLRETIELYALGSGEQTLLPEAPQLDALAPEVRDAAAMLRQRVDDDERTILELVTGLAVAIAKNSYAWREIDVTLHSLRAQLDRIGIAIDEAAAGAELAGEAGGRMRVALGAMREGFGAALAALALTLERVERVRESVGAAASFVQSTSQAAQRAATILELIDTISSETTLLSLNAAIEAAHAGRAGSGFGVIAGEIRVLAETTSRATGEVGAVIASLGEASGAIGASIDGAVVQTTAVQERTAQMQGGVAELRREIDTTLDHAAEVAAIVEQQHAALSDVRAAADAARRSIDADAAAATDDRRLELAMLGMRAHALAARRPLGTVAEEIRAIGLSAAAEMDAAFDAAIDGRAIRLEDCFDTAYVELTGVRIARLARLFDISKVPSTGFDPPKFETRYDAAVEGRINALIDAGVGRHPAIAAMFAVDLNGYCFAHYRTCRQDWTGDRVTDLNHNRIKRFFDDGLSLRCSRVGLGRAADVLPPRTAYARFRDAGCVLRAAHERAWAIYTYARDTGVVYNDLSIALFAKGHRVGTIRIIYDAAVV